MSHANEHHRKIESESRDALRLQHMLRAHRMRLAYAELGWFKARDPLPPRARVSARNYLARARHAARMFLAVAAARRRDAAKTITRGRLRLVAGGQGRAS